MNRRHLFKMLLAAPVAAVAAFKLAPPAKPQKPCVCSCCQLLIKPCTSYIWCDEFRCWIELPDNTNEQLALAS